MAPEMPASIRDALRAFESRLRDRFGARLKEIRLFGSFARGEANEDSDVDVLVLVDGLTPLEVGDVSGEATVVALETGLALAPLPMSTAHFEELRSGERLLAKVIDTEGITLDAR